MRFSKVIVLALSFVLLASLAVTAQKDNGAAKAAKIVVAAIDTEGVKNLLAQPREHPLLVNFWATYCDPCRDEFPDLVKIDNDYRPRSLEFVTISLDDVSEIKNEVPKFLDSMNATMPAYLLDVSDPEPAINLFDPKWQGALPATFLFNTRGEVVYKHVGRVDPVKLRSEIDKLVKK